MLFEEERRISPFEIEDGVLIKYNGSETCVTIPDKVETIGTHAFLGCELVTLKLSDSVTCIDYESFLNCDRLHSVTIPASVEYIGGKAFGYHVTESHPYQGYGYYSSYFTHRVFGEQPGFTIRGKKGTAAERYAKENGFRFEEG